jgi:hypothetical protein
MRRVAVLVGLAWLLEGGPARADGAFPDASRILLPSDEAQVITLATNFGLISTSDDGATWTWACETPLLNGGRGYQLAADGGGALRRIVALSSWGLVHSDDVGCTWSPSEGAGQDDAFTDVFVSPATPTSAWILGIDPNQDMGLPQVVFTSTDGAANLSGPLYQAQEKDQLLGVESAATDRATVYVTLASGPESPSFALTLDGGAHWETRVVAGAVGPGYLRILAVDARSASTVYLRQSTTNGDRLLVTRDSGITWTVALSVTGSFSAFLQREDGTLLVGVLDSDDNATGYRSSDGGRTFLPWAGVPHLRALAERGGALFAAADDTKDGFALGVSLDGGLTFRPRLRYAEVSSVAACVQRECRVTCERLAGLGLWSSRLCVDSLPGSSADAGMPDDAAPTDGAAPLDAGHGPRPSPPGGGCSVVCAHRPRRDLQELGGAALALIAVLCRRSLRATRRN